ALGDFDDALAEAYVRDAARTISELEGATSVRWELQPGWPDYHAELPGARTEGRSLEIGPVQVGPESLRAVRPDPYGVAPITVNEERSPDPPDADEITRRRREGIVSRGRGLVAALHDAFRELGGEIRCGVA